MEVADHSTVFADMLSLPQEPNKLDNTITLRDCEFENAKSLRTALTLVTRISLDFELKKDSHWE